MPSFWYTRSPHFPANASIVSKVGEISDIHVSNVRKILAGSTNSNLDTFEKCVEALGKRIIIIEVPDTTELNLFLSKYGNKKNKFWKLPYNKNNNNLSDFLLKFLGIEEKTQPYSEEAFQLISVLDAAAAKKGEDNKELLDKMKRFDLYGWISLMSQLIIINRALYVNKQQEA